MTLFSENKQRKWQCFVCYREYLTAEEMKDHIVSSHEESREYLLCPVKHCQYPVRDIGAHIKARHPGIRCPKGIQLKAIVWNDWVKGKRKKKVNFKAGGFVSIKNDGAIINYRSGWELDVYMMLEEWSEVLKYEAEPFAVPYVRKNENGITEWHKYYPDIKVCFIDGSIEIWEIKPQNQTSNSTNQSKWGACAEHCKNFGWAFKVKTEKGINDLRQEIINERKNQA